MATCNGVQLFCYVIFYVQTVITLYQKSFVTKFQLNAINIKVILKLKPSCRGIIVLNLIDIQKKGIPSRIYNIPELIVTHFNLTKK